MHEFQGQHLVNFGRVVPPPVEVPAHHGLKALPFEVRTGKSPRIKQHFPDVLGEVIAVPDPKMTELMPAEEKPLEAEGRKEMIYPGYPLGHTVVVSVFRFKSELEESSVDRRWQMSVCSGQAPIRPDPPESCVSVGDQSQADLVARERRLRRTENRPDEIVIKKRGPQGKLRFL